MSDQSLKLLNWIPQIGYQVQWWQQRNAPIIHDVTNVKYNKKNEIFSH